MSDVLKRIELLGIVPVIKLDDANDALPLAKALCQGGLPCAEVTFRTDAAASSIKAMTQAYPDMLVGAGTVLTTTQVDKAIEAGASFIVSPGLNPNIVTYCISKNIPIVPGCCNPSDVEQAIALGLDVVKFFPAQAAGGLNMIKSMAAPYVDMKFMPTGGINPDNLNSYLDFDKIIACGGTWMVPDGCITSKDFNMIETLTKKAVEQMLGFSLGHIGLNTNSVESANQIANFFDQSFGFTKVEKSASIFAGSFIEAMKQPFLGSNGHIAIETNYIHRAIRYLEYKGISFKEDTKSYNAAGKLTAIYLQEEIAGFAIHLLSRAK